jgi:hypothetical protein
MYSNGRRFSDWLCIAPSRDEEKGSPFCRAQRNANEILLFFSGVFVFSPFFLGCLILSNHPPMEVEEANPNLQLNTALWQCGNSV